MHTCMAILTSIPQHLHPLEQEYSFIQNHRHKKIGQPIGNMDGTLYHHWNTIAVSNIMYQQPTEFKMLINSSSLLPILIY